jgi:hypothetical protein
MIEEEKKSAREGGRLRRGIRKKYRRGFTASMSCSSLSSVSSEYVRAKEE